MKSRPAVLIAGILGVLVVAALGWYFISPLFIDNTVDEAFPFEVPTEGEMAAMSEAEKKAMEQAFLAAVPSAEELASLSPEERAEVGARVDAAAATIMTDNSAEELMPESGGEPLLLSEGQFIGADSFHQGSGRAAVYELPEGDRVLRFEDFNVTNGPDLHVILVKEPDPTAAGDVGEDYIDLGSIKGNIGNQNYDIPADIDPSQYQSVVIYCLPFHVIFASATLN